jgi:mannan endo-1,4-beta-mannosidase
MSSRNSRHSSRFVWAIIFFCLGVAGAQEGFRIDGPVIIGPDGHEFIPMGANVGGPTYSWDRKTSQDLEWIKDVWNFNCIRTNSYVIRSENKGGWPLYPGESLEKIVDTYTPHGIVVMHEAHDFTVELFNQATDAEFEKLKEYWRGVATKFKDNPYVWFNIMNEPGDSLSFTLYDKWVSIHREFIDMIRNEVGAENIIVVDGMYGGQDAGFTKDSGMVPEEKSAILSHGLEILQGNENILFAFHVYTQWRGTETRMEDYVTRVREKGMALVCGEAGAGTSGYGSPPDYRRASSIAYAVCPPNNVGILAWHFQPGDHFALTTSGDEWGRDVNSRTEPTNLTAWAGEPLWEYTHSGRYGLEHDPVTVSVPSYRITPVLHSHTPVPFFSLTGARIDATSPGRHVPGIVIAPTLCPDRSFRTLIGFSRQ